MPYRRTQSKKIKKNKSRKNKSRKDKSRRYRRQRGGDIEPQTETSIVSSLEKGLDETNKKIGDVKKQTEEGISSMFGSITSLFGSSNETQPITSSGGKRRNLKYRRTHKR
jgi:hypothetical protein